MNEKMKKITSVFVPIAAVALMLGVTVAVSGFAAHEKSDFSQDFSSDSETETRGDYYSKSDCDDNGNVSFIPDKGNIRNDTTVTTGDVETEPDSNETDPEPDETEENKLSAGDKLGITDPKETTTYETTVERAPEAIWPEGFETETDAETSDEPDGETTSEVTVDEPDETEAPDETEVPETSEPETTETDETEAPETFEPETTESDETTSIPEPELPTTETSDEVTT